MINNYTLERKTYIQEIDSDVYIYQHHKTKAQIIYIANEDTHKTFGIGFKTPPQDSTGIAHIIEHSVLCGSKKYPLKDPFVELAKGSLNTYLNAMTYPDKTLYPISSQNDDDFKNLMDVYLDAVFFPTIYNEEYILMQEGWRYHIEDKSDELVYKGVVYNEMQGAFSSPDELIFRKIKEVMFPSTIYKNESGGDPDYIPELTYEDFLAFHKKYYHPSNAYICLYGKMDINAQLAYIDRQYLSQFEYQQIDACIPMQPAFNQVIEKSFAYSVSEEKDNQLYLAYNFIIDEATNKELMLAMSILEYVLLDTPASLLKRALIKEGIGEDVFCVFHTHIKQPIFSIVGKNVTKDKEQRFYQLINDTLTAIVSEGIPEKLLSAALQVKEFELREADAKGYSKGLMYFIGMIKNWVYDGTVEDALRYEEVLAHIKDNAYNNYFTDIIKEYLIDNPSKSKIKLYPEVDLNKKRSEALREKLQQIKASWSEEELNQRVEKTHQFIQYQQKEDSVEAKNSIPLLKKEQLDLKTQYPRFEVYQKSSQYIVTPTFTNQITYLNIYINLVGIEDKYTPYLGMLVGMLGKLDTGRFDYAELSTYIDENIGGIQYDVVSQFNYDKDCYQRYFKVKTKALNAKLNEQLEVIKELIMGTSFEDKIRLREIIKEIKAILEMSIGGDGHKVALSRLNAHFSEGDQFGEESKGLSFYHFVKSVDEKWEIMQDEFIAGLKEAYSCLSNVTRYTIGLTTEDSQVHATIDTIEQLLQTMPRESITPLTTRFMASTIKEGLLFPGNVNYVAAGGNFKADGYQYSGSMQMLKSILSMDYLWTKVRVENGAYGCFAGFRKSGNVFFVSYRDPNVSKTLSIYKEIPKYVAALTLDERQMLQYLIGTISNLDFPYTPATEGETAQVYHLAAVTKESLQQSRDELFATTNETLRSFAPLLEDLFKQQSYCVFGNTSSIESEKALFDEITTV